MTINPTPELFLTEAEVAELLRLAPSTLRAIRERQEITFLRIGFNRGRILYTKQDVEKFIERNRRVAAMEAA